MLRLIPALLLPLLLQADPPVTVTLVTPHYTVHITELCVEDVACNRVIYQSVSRAGTTLTLHGNRVVVMCGDGVTPCHPIGYEFFSSNTKYFVGDDGELKVTQGSKTILDEKGAWKSDCH